MDDTFDRGDGSPFNVVPRPEAASAAEASEAQAVIASSETPQEPAIADAAGAVAPEVPSDVALSAQSQSPDDFGQEPVFAPASSPFAPPAAPAEAASTDTPEVDRAAMSDLTPIYHAQDFDPLSASQLNAPVVSAPAANPVTVVPVFAEEATPPEVPTAAAPRDAEVSTAVAPVDDDLPDVESLAFGVAPVAMADSAAAFPVEQPVDQASDVEMSPFASVHASEADTAQGNAAESVTASAEGAQPTADDGVAIGSEGSHLGAGEIAGVLGLAGATAVTSMAAVHLGDEATTDERAESAAPADGALGAPEPAATEPSDAPEPRTAPAVEPEMAEPSSDPSVLEAPAAEDAAAPAPEAWPAAEPVAAEAPVDAAPIAESPVGDTPVAEAPAVEPVSAEPAAVEAAFELPAYVQPTPEAAVEESGSMSSAVVAEESAQAQPDALPVTQPRLPDVPNAPEAASAGAAFSVPPIYTPYAPPPQPPLPEMTPSTSAVAAFSEDAEDAQPLAASPAEQPATAEYVTAAEPEPQLAVQERVAERVEAPIPEAAQPSAPELVAEPQVTTEPAPPPTFTMPSQPIYPPAPAAPSQPVYPPMAPTVGQGQPYGQAASYTPGAQSFSPALAQSYPQPHRNVGVALAVEAIGGLFGFFGIGWLLSGYTTTGLLLLVGGIIWDVVGFFLGVFTFGVFFLCVGVVNIIALVTSTIILSQRLNQPVR